MKSEWVFKKLDDVCLIKGRIGYRGYTKQDLVEKGKGAISLSPSNIKSNKLFFNSCTYISWEKYEESPEIMVFEGDIIFCKTASIGKMALVDFLPEKATLNPQFVVLKNINCFNKFLYYFMTSEGFKKQIDEIIGGTAVPTLSQKNLGNLEIPIPPLEEQQTIVAKLDQAFAAIDQAKANIEKNIANAKELFQSKLNQIFSQKGDGWEEKRIDEICQNFDSKRIPITKNKRIEGIYPYYGASGIVDYVSDFIFEGDYLLVSEDGANLLARTYPIAFSVNGKFWVNNHAHILKFVNSNTQKFVEYYLNSIKLDDYVSGMAQPKLNQAKLNSILVPIPFNDFDSQQQIVTQLDQLQEQTNLLVTKYQQKLANLEELKKSILEKAFKGELS